MSQKKAAGSLFRFLTLASTFFLFQQGQALACSTSAWSSTDGTAVTAVNAAAYEGDCGLRLTLSGTATGLVKDATPGTVTPAVTEYVARFYAYFDDAQLSNGSEFTLFNALDSGSNELFSLKARGTAAGTALYLEDADSGKATNNLLVPTGWRAIVLHWNTSGSGQLELIIDREQDGMTETITGLTNSGQEIDSIQLGAITNNAGTSGNVDIDSFLSRRAGTGGLMVQKSCSGTDVVLKNATFLSDSSLTCNVSGTLSFGSRVTFDPNTTVNVVAQSVAMGPGISIPQGAVLDISIQ
ncbi:MAG TPA: hypothetical protein ENJ12_00075 [Thiolapillus brandeum]|uniref:Uncharacterized protein n=1 Tax=Thiolapillus brandeum TaxID=1076588 RepID=A0A831RT32_9GAMM|nr:hypothetical protein [Thiolapillus brandeum]